MSGPYDLHTHSTASDGTLTPRALLERAHAAGIGTLALTDHDSTEGLAEAQAAAADLGVRLVEGVEVSVTWHAQVVHVLGLRIDPACPSLAQGLARLRSFRDWRAEEMGRRLAKAGIPDACAGARKYAVGTILSRTHFARYLVESGHARDVREVFKRYLVRGKPGHVPGEWATLEEAVAWIRAAGGDAVIAHPARYRLTGTRLRALIGEFVACGGIGIEVVSGSHSRDDVLAMAGCARRHRLYASCGSDYHGPENPWIELGNLPALPEGCIPIWQAWPEAGDTAAALRATRRCG